MDRQTAIRRAKDRLVNSRDLMEHLNRVGFVQVLPKLDLPIGDLPPRNKPFLNHIVTFTIEETHLFGKRLMAEYQGVKEYAA